MKNKIKIALDTAMTIIFILLLNKSATGMRLHEILGLAIFGVFIIHKLLNLSMIKGIFKGIFSGKGKPRVIATGVVDTALLLCVTLTVLSGIFISKELFTSLSVPGFAFWKAVHTPSAYWALVLISIHLGMHWQYIIAAFRKMLAIKGESTLRKVVLRAFALILAIAGIQSAISDNFVDKLVPQSTTKQEEKSYASTASSSTQLSASSDTNSGSYISLSSTSTTTDSQTLDDYLGTLHCTGCHRNCSLLSPQCGRGEQQAAQAETEYYETISAATETDTATATDAAAQTAEPEADETATENAATEDVMLDATTGEAQDQTSATEETQAAATDSTANDTSGTEADSTATGEVSAQESASGDTAQNTQAAPPQAENSGLNVTEAVNTAVDYFPIMALFVAGTHYVVTIPAKIKKGKSGKK